MLLWLCGKESACNVGDWGLTPGSRSSSGEGNGYPLQYSCLGNPMVRGAWRTTVHGVTKSWTWLNTHMHENICVQVCVIVWGSKYSSSVCRVTEDSGSRSLAQRKWKVYVALMTWNNYLHCFSLNFRRPSFILFFLAIIFLLYFFKFAAIKYRRYKLNAISHSLQ